MVQIDQSGTSMGSANTFYVSIPSSQTDCSDLGLPSLPDNWFYACSNSTNYRKVDGTGWIPVNFTSLSYRTPLEILPIDPINTTSTGNYYTYITGGSWELNAMFESSKYRFSGEKDRTSKDGGDFWAVYELGSNLTLSPLNNSGLVSYWKFDGGTSGSIANNTTIGFEDAAGNNNGTAKNANGTGMAWTTGKLSGAVSFDGTDDYIYIPSFPFPDSEGTMEAWVWFPSATQSTHGTILRIDGASPWTYHILQRNPNSNYISYTVYDGSNDRSVGYTVVPGNWYHLVATHSLSSNKIELFINGISRNTGSHPTVTTCNGKELGIGAISDGGNPLKGSIDEVRIYNRALSAAEISAIYNATK